MIWRTAPRNGGSPISDAVVLAMAYAILRADAPVPSSSSVIQSASPALAPREDAAYPMNHSLRFRHPKRAWGQAHLTFAPEEHKYKCAICESGAPEGGTCFTVLSAKPV